MITPKDMEKFTNNDVVTMYQKLNERLSKTIISKLRQSGDISTFTRSQIRQLQLQGGKEIFKKALEETAGLNQKRKQEIQDLFDEIGEQELKGYSEVYKMKGIDYELSSESKQLIKTTAKRTNGELRNLTRTIAYASQKTFIDAMDELYKDVATGSYDYESAIKRTVSELADKGVTLTTKDGRHEKLEVAVKRNLLTSIKQTANSIAKDVGDTIGANCVVIGHSTKCRPTHYPIDAVTMSLPKFEELEYLTEEPNCYHIVNYDWRPDFEGTKSKVEYLDDHESYADVVKNYNIQQKARYYERQVRAKKEAIASGNNSDEAKIQLRNAQAKLRIYNKVNGLEQDYLRTWVAGYNGKNKKIYNTQINAKQQLKENIPKNIKDFYDYYKSKSQKILTPNNLNKILGYDELPELVSKKQFEQLAKNNKYGVLERGVKTGKGTSDINQIIENYKKGEFYVGEGIFGSGTYTHYGEDAHRRALSYAANNEDLSTEKNVIKYLLKDDAKVAKYKELKKMRDEEVDKLIKDNGFKDYSDVLENGFKNINTTEIAKYIMELQDMGVYASIKGYDAIDTFYENPWGDENRYIVILNRKKMVMYD